MTIANSEFSAEEIDSLGFDAMRPSALKWAEQWGRYIVNGVPPLERGD